jgi:hypothetical protein
VYFVGGSVAGDVPIPPHFRGILKVQRDSPKGTLQTVDGERAASAEYVVKYQRKLVGSFPSLRAAALAYDFRILTLRREAATAGSVSILPSRGPALNFADAEGLFEAELKAGRNPEHSVLDLADDPALAHGAVSPIAPRPRGKPFEAGAGQIGGAHRIPVPFEEARARARTLGLSTRAGWMRWLRAERAGGAAGAAELPMRPELTYKGKGFTTMADFLGAPEPPPRPERTAGAAGAARRRDVLVAGYSEIRPAAPQGESLALPASVREVLGGAAQEGEALQRRERALAAGLTREMRRTRMEQRRRAPPPSLLLPLPVSLLYTPPPPPYCCPYPCPHCTLSHSLPSRRAASTVEDMVAPQWGWRLCKEAALPSAGGAAPRPELVPLVALRPLGGAPAGQGCAKRRRGVALAGEAEPGGERARGLRSARAEFLAAADWTAGEGGGAGAGPGGAGGESVPVGSAVDSRDVGRAPAADPGADWGPEALRAPMSTEQKVKMMEREAKAKGLLPAPPRRAPRRGRAAASAGALRGGRAGTTWRTGRR